MSDQTAGAAVAVVVSNNAQLSTFCLLIGQLNRNPRILKPIMVFAEPEALAGVASLGLANVEIAGVPQYRRSRVRRRLLTFAHLVLADSQHSPYFQGILSSSLDKRTLQAAAVRLVRSLVPQVTTPVYNRRMDLLARLLWPRTRPPTKHVIVISQLSSPVLVAGGSTRVGLVVDGWDHPSAVPCGFIADVVIGWNRALADEWLERQGGGQSVEGFPFRLEYLLRDGADLRPNPPVRARGTRAMYAMATYPAERSIQAARHAEELRMLRLVAFELDRIGLTFVVKPHPIGPAGHLDEVCESIGCELLSYEDSGPANYSLSAEYNQRRINELRSVDLVVGTWTTFLLDAAVAGLPIVPVSFEPGAGYPTLEDAMRGLHISHLRNRAGVGLLVDAGGVSTVGSDESAGDLLNRGAAATAKVREWLMPKSALEDVVDGFVDALLS